MTDAQTAPGGRNNGSAIARSPTGIRGVDEVLRGGLPSGRTTLVGGGAGTGKTVFALEFLYRGALKGEPGVFVTFEERAEAIRRNAKAIGWDLDRLEQEGKLAILEAALPLNLVQSGEFDLTGLLAILGGQATALGATRIVIDAADVLLRVFRKPARQEDQIFALHDWLLEQKATSIVTVKTDGTSADALQRLEYMVDCVVRLDQRVRGQVATRRMRVVKYRGSAFLSNEYPYIIADGGLVLMPVSTSILSEATNDGRVTTGVAGLDGLLGGGFRRGSTVLLAGASGTGKTTIAASLASAACSAGDRVLYLGLEESAPSLVASMQSAGIDLQREMDAGRLRIITAMPEAHGVEEHLWNVMREIAAFSPDHLVVDAISACQRMGSDEAAFDFLLRLMTHCKTHGVTCVYLNQLDEVSSVHRISGVGVSSLVDTVLLLEQDWPDDTLRRRLLIVKSRGTSHSPRRHTFRITDHGVVMDVASDEALAGGVR